MAPIPPGSPAGTEAKPESWRLRLFNRFTQFCWLLGVLLLWTSWSIFSRALAAARPMGTPIPPISWVFAWGALAAAIIGLIGFVTTCIYMGSLAEWAYDDVTGKRLRVGPVLALLIGVPLGLLASSLCIRLINFGIAPLTLASFGVVAGLFVASVWPLVSGMISFVHLMRWALVNRDEALASYGRRAARIVQRIEEGQRVKP